MDVCTHALCLVAGLALGVVLERRRRNRRVGVVLQLLRPRRRSQ